jgi:hypothetical protein
VDTGPGIDELCRPLQSGTKTGRRVQPAAAGRGTFVLANHLNRFRAHPPKSKRFNLAYDIFIKFFKQLNPKTQNGNLGVQNFEPLASEGNRRKPQ